MQVDTQESNLIPCSTVFSFLRSYSLDITCKNYHCLVFENICFPVHRDIDYQVRCYSVSFLFTYVFVVMSLNF